MRIQRASGKEEIREALGPILEIILFCAEKNTPLLDYHDDGLLKFREIDIAKRLLNFEQSLERMI